MIGTGEKTGMEVNSIRILTNPRRSLILLGLLLGLIYGMSVLPMAALYYVSAGILLFPLAGLVLAAVGGWAALALAGGIIAFGAYRIFGMPGLLILAYALPAGIALLTAIELKLPWTRALLAVLAAFIAGTLAIYLLLQRVTGSDLFGFTSEAVIAGLDQFPQRDALLYNFWKGGFLSHGQPEGTQIFIENGKGWTFTPAVLKEFYQQITLRISILMKSLFQGLLTSFALYISALGSNIALRAGKSAQPDSCPDLGMPSFETWHIPLALGKRLWVPAAGYLLMLISRSPVIQLAGSLMFNVFYAVYAIQGLAVLSHRFHQGSMRAWLRRLILLLLFTVLQPMLVFIGILDQMRDTRGLRPINRETGE